MEIKRNYRKFTDIEVMLEPEEIEEILIKHVAEKAGIDSERCDDITVFLDNKIRENGPCILFEITEALEGGE